jgi:sulfur relay (sulfurtransferase) DsrC/TusE family protein
MRTATTRDGRSRPRPVATDSEGYLLHLDDWSEDFAARWRARKGWC